MTNKPVCVVVGVGPGNGAAFARRFDREGYAVALLARSDEFSKQVASGLSEARAFACDVGDAASVERAFAAIREQLGPPAVVVFNAGSGLFGTFDAITPQDFEAAWRVNTLGAFLVAKQVVPAMEAAGKGAIVFVGATASRRGMPRTVAFAPAKAAQRSLAEALARGEVQVAIARASDFIGPNLPSAWFGDRFFQRAFAGKTTECLGDPDQLHSYTYADDVAAALVELGAQCALLAHRRDRRGLGHRPGRRAVHVQAVERDELRASGGRGGERAAA